MITKYGWQVLLWIMSIYSFRICLSSLSCIDKMSQCKLAMIHAISKHALCVLRYIYTALFCITFRCCILIRVLATSFVNYSSAEWGECVVTNDRVAIRFPNQALNSIPLKANPDNPPVMPQAIAVLTKPVGHKMKWMLFVYFRSREHLACNCNGVTRRAIHCFT